MFYFGLGYSLYILYFYKPKIIVKFVLENKNKK